jgi:hypothetical protein
MSGDYRPECETGDNAHGQNPAPPGIATLGEGRSSIGARSLFRVDDGQTGGYSGPEVPVAGASGTQQEFSGSDGI